MINLIAGSTIELTAVGAREVLDMALSTDVGIVLQTDSPDIARQRLTNAMYTGEGRERYTGLALRSAPEGDGHIAIVHKRYIADKPRSYIDKSKLLTSRDDLSIDDLLGKDTPS